MEPASLAMIAAPLAVGLAGIGPGIGIGMMTGAFFNAVSRQPEIQGSVQGFLFLMMGVIELLGLLGFVTFFLLAWKLAPVMQ